MSTGETREETGTSKEEYVPSKIVCVGRNYVEHISELGNERPKEMVMFCKPNSAITDVLQSYHQEPLHYEAEICYLVKEGIPAAVACGLDLTKRALQSKLIAEGLPWERAKGFDGSALFGPFVPLSDPWQELEIELYINGALKQHGTTSMMIYKPQDIMREIGSVMTLDDGDIVMTGTPAGVGEVTSGANYMCRLLSGGEELVSCNWIAV